MEMIMIIKLPIKKYLGLSEEIIKLAIHSVLSELLLADGELHNKRHMLLKETFYKKKNYIMSCAKQNSQWGQLTTAQIL